MRSIPLGDSGCYTLVDDEDYDDLMRFHWFLHFAGYAHYQSNGRRGSHHNVFMHRMLTDAQKGDQIDHINQDKLDNRKCNLRICTAAENRRNHKVYSTNKSGFTGVSELGGKWRAAIVKDYKQTHIGLFDTREDAAHAYDKVALELFGSFASLNFGE